VIVFGHNFLFSTIEEVGIESLNQNGLTITLTTKVNNAVNVGQPTHTGSARRIDACKTLGILLCMSCLIEVD
jgi:hypothetical protein